MFLVAMDMAFDSCSNRSDNQIIVTAVVIIVVAVVVITIVVVMVVAVTMVTMVTRFFPGL